MAERQWYAAIGGKQEGPFSDERMRGLIAAGSVRADTLVWCAGMSNWARAAEIPGLMSGAPVPPPSPPAVPSAAGARVADADGATGALATGIRVWPYFGRVVLIIIGQILIVPMPWVITSFYRWFVDNIDLPGGQRVTFIGKPGDIWYIFMLSALCGYVGLIGRHGAGLSSAVSSAGANLLLLLVTPLFIVIIARWFCRNLAWDGQTAPLAFTGGYWPMLGWYVLLALSFITIIGWAWVVTAWARWQCRHIEGSARKLVFNASGWGVLWRSILLFLLCVLLIPIPWALRWFTRWLVSQYALVHDGAPGAGAV